MTPREALLAAARVCESLWDEHDKARAELHSSYHEGAADAAEECERRILALAEQQPAEPKCAAKHGYCVPCGGSLPIDGGCWKEDQRGAAALQEVQRQAPGQTREEPPGTAGRGDGIGGGVAPAVTAQSDPKAPVAQSAPHPDPAGQEVALPADAPDPIASAVESVSPALPGPETVSAASEAAAIPCCGEYATCMRACVPRGEWLATERLRLSGMEIVPREPTEVMIEAMLCRWMLYLERYPNRSLTDRMRATYSAMLAAGSAK